jgi:formylglycine-generating enzyme required for sulfatase activity
MNSRPSVRPFTKRPIRPARFFWALAVLLSGLSLSPGQGAETTPADAKTAPAAPASPPKAGQTCTVSLPSNVTLDLVPIPAGTFTMGSPDTEDGRLIDEGPQHVVTISKNFWLGKYPVTQAQYLALIGENPSVFRTDPNLPLEFVSWDDANAFCQKLTDQEKAAGRLPDGYAYQLPTEAQWEYACRAGTTTAYAGDFEAMAWYVKNSNGTSHPVGQKKPNAWGLYDMHGNIRQWCADKYAPYAAAAVTDPLGIKGQFRVIRGGSWYLQARDCRSASRYSAVPGGIGGNSGLFTSSILGFRVALAPKLAY